MSNCINNNCQLCKNLVFSDSVTVVTVDGTDTLVIDIPAGVYQDNKKVCLVITQTIPAGATIYMPVAISIGGDTTTVYPIVKCDCTQATACAFRTRKKYPLRINTTATSAVFKSLGGLSCCPPTNALQAIPATTTAVGTSEAVEPTIRTTAVKTTVKAVKEVKAE